MRRGTRVSEMGPAPVTRPLVRWHGGKYRMAPWIIKFMPKHRFYLEPYGGGASVLLRKPRSYAEVYNDLDETIVSLFRVLRDREQASRLVELIGLTPFARSEFDLAYDPTDDPVESARRTLVRSFMGFGSDGTAGIYRTGFRCNVSRTGTTPATDWAGYKHALPVIIDRLQGVTIEQRPALELIDRFDNPEAVIYLDPPYLPETRSAGNRRRGQGFHVYTHEMEEEDHVELIDRCLSSKSMILISGYPSKLYDASLKGFLRKTRKAYADGGKPRTECLWINPNAARALEHGPLFGGWKA